VKKSNQNSTLSEDRVPLPGKNEQLSGALGATVSVFALLNYNVDY